MNFEEVVAITKKKYVDYLSDAQKIKAEVTNSGIELGGELLVSIKNLKDKLQATVDVADEKIKEIKEDAKEVIVDSVEVVKAKTDEIREIRTDIIEKIRGRKKKEKMDE